MIKKTRINEVKKIPHTFVLLFSVMLIVALLTYIIPAGEYARVEDPNTGRTVVDPLTYENVEKTPVNLFGVFNAIPKGMNGASTITFFIFIIAGAFQIINSTGAIEQFILKITNALQGKEGLLIPIFMFVFSLSGAFFGFSEEHLVFVPIIIALSRALGYDAMVGMALITVGGNVGFNSAMMNPFNVGVAQGIAELPLFSGLGLRVIIWVVYLVISVIYVMKYAKKVKEDPKLSLVAELEESEREEHLANMDKESNLRGSHLLVLLTLLAGFIAIIIGVYKLGWYMNEIAATFLAVGVVSGLISKIRPSKMAEEFIIGAKSIVFGALVVGFARGILIIMQEGNILDAIVHGLASPISLVPKSISAVFMMFVQMLINFFIPSATGQAAVTMPIMAPLADIIGLTRQTAVLAFQFGDGFTNIIQPTAATLFATLSIAKIPYDRWFKFMGRLMIIWICLGAIFMFVASVINYGPF